MQNVASKITTRTTTDVVFEKLYADISNLTLLPGTRISEADIASQMGVSRQPVRDAFNRLGNLGLLLIRPQRATEVRAFSMDEIRNARFIRLSIELELVSQACQVWTPELTAELEACIVKQQTALEAQDTKEFHALDYDFHKVICDSTGNALAFETIQKCKRSVDRLCVLSLRKAYEISAILDDHRDIAKALDDRSETDARATTRRHLARLDATIAEIYEAHSEYFE